MRILMSILSSQVIKEAKEYYLEDDPANEEPHVLTSLEAVSNVVVASLDNRGTLELW